MTTPHSLILAELEKYRGGEFVPVRYFAGIPEKIRSRNDGFGWEWGGTGYRQWEWELHHSQVLIELAAVVVAAMEHEMPQWNHVYRFWTLPYMSKPYQTLAYALLAALEKINGK